MVHRNINNIEMPHFLWKKLNPIGVIKDNIAFDTETTKGRCFLISDSQGRYLNNNQFTDLYGLLQYLNTKDYRNSVNWFYNLEYDTNAILHFLKFEDRKHIAEFNFVDYEGYRISIIPKKQLKISVLKNEKLFHSTMFFDLAQFYNYKKLVNLAKQTNYAKVMVDDISQINVKKYYENNEYHKLINDRCIIDCKITVELADKLTDNIKKIVGVNNYQSKASIARRYVLENISKNLKMPSNKMLDAALKAYHAGHIEVCKLGTFENIYNYDINSAYPTEIANLYETSGNFKNNKDYDLDTAYSFYHIEIDYDHDTLSPLWYLKGQANYHVTGQFDTWVSNPELEYLINMGYDYKIITAYHITKNKYTEQPFKDIINDLYKERIKAKDNKDEIEKVYKVILNSIYGVTLNTINKKELCEYETDLYKIIDDKIVFYQSTYKATNMYNPVYGATITAGTRTKLFTDFHKDLDNVVAVNTDGMYMKNKVGVSLTKKLGDYSFKHISKLMLLGSGRYFIFENGVIDDSTSRFRSIPKNPTEIYEIMRANKNAESITLEREKPIKLKESVTQHNLHDKFNQFQKVVKQIYFKTERRHWFNQVEKVSDLWDTEIDSRPFSVDEIS